MSYKDSWANFWESSGRSSDRSVQTYTAHLLQCLSVNLAFFPTVNLYQHIEFWNTSDLLHQMEGQTIVKSMTAGEGLSSL